MAKTTELDFETSSELRQLFHHYFELWKRKHHGTLELLAERCGVTASYLGHVNRYGRIPGRPVLILLAANFELRDPHALFEAARTQEPWPFPEAMKLTSFKEDTSSFLSVKLDMEGLTQTIREIVRHESKARSVRELTRGNPLRIGVNLGKSALVQREENEQGDTLYGGFFGELCRLLSLSLQTRVELKKVSHLRAEELLGTGEIDIYGPSSFTPERRGKLLFTRPLLKQGLSALWRKRADDELEKVKPPQTIDALREERYRIAVLRSSGAHHFAHARLGRGDETLILCESAEEALDRITLSGIANPAHLMLCDSSLAVPKAEKQNATYELLAFNKSPVLATLEQGILVRPDWGDLVLHLNESLEYFASSGALQDLYHRYIPDQLRSGLFMA